MTKLEKIAIWDFQSMFIYLIYKELSQAKRKNMNISIKRFAWETQRQLEKR